MSNVEEQEGVPASIKRDIEFDLERVDGWLFIKQNNPNKWILDTGSPTLVLAEGGSHGVSFTASQVDVNGIEREEEETLEYAVNTVEGFIGRDQLPSGISLPSVQVQSASLGPNSNGIFGISPAPGDTSTTLFTLGNPTFHLDAGIRRCRINMTTSSKAVGQAQFENANNFILPCVPPVSPTSWWIVKASTLTMRTDGNNYVQYIFDGKNVPQCLVAEDGTVGNAPVAANCPKELFIVLDTGTPSYTTPAYDTANESQVALNYQPPVNEMELVCIDTLGREQHLVMPVTDQTRIMIPYLGGRLGIFQAPEYPSAISLIVGIYGMQALNRGMTFDPANLRIAVEPPQ